MDREKQIEEMANSLYETITHLLSLPTCRVIAEDVIKLGYRKQSEGEWVSVEEQEEPSENGIYICYGYWIGSGRQQVETASYYDEWNIANNFVLTHWMPLPEPPKMKGGDTDA